MGRARLPVKGARGPSQGKTVAQARWDNLAIQSRRPTEERGKNGIGLSLKENLKYLWKAALTTI